MATIGAADRTVIQQKLSGYVPPIAVNSEALAERALADDFVILESRVRNKAGCPERVMCGSLSL